MDILKLPYSVIRDKKTRDYFQLSLTLLVTSIFIAFAIRPSIVSVISSLKTISDLKTLQNNLDAKITALNTANQIYERQKNNFLLLDKAVPLSPEEDRLLTEIDIASVINQVKVTSISFRYDPEGPINRLVFRIEVSGDYNNTEDFLSELNKLLRIVEINSIKFDSEKSERLNTVETEITGVAYYEPKN